MIGKKVWCGQWKKTGLPLKCPESLSWCAHISLSHRMMGGEVKRAQLETTAKDSRFLQISMPFGKEEGSAILMRKAAFGLVLIMQSAECLLSSFVLIGADCPHATWQEWLLGQVSFPSPLQPVTSLPKECLI